MTRFYAILMLALLPVLAAVGHEAGGSIVYSSMKSGNWEIWLMNGNGSGAKQLTRTPLEEKSPSLSPDGKQVAFANNKGQLFIADREGKEIEHIRLPLEVVDQPSWHPDGKSLVIFSLLTRPEENSNIWYLQTTRPYRMTKILEHKDMKMHPAFSPDGKHLVFSLFHRTPDLLPVEELWMKEMESGKLTQLTKTDAENFHADWSPDGSSIVFTSNIGGNYDIWLMHLDKPGIFRLTTHPGYDGTPTFSPDGKHIAFASSRTGTRHIWSMTVDGTELRQLTTGKADNKDPYWGK